jgi:hypothetical protein
MTFHPIIIGTPLRPSRSPTGERRPPTLAARAAPASRLRRSIGNAAGAQAVHVKRRLRSGESLA